MAKSYGLIFRKSTLQAARGVKKSCAARRKNQEILIAAFSYAYPAGAGASQIVAVYSVPITTTWTIRYPIVPPSSSFVPVIRWVTGGVTFRYKLWAGVGEVLNVPTYIGEAIPAGAAIEIWTASANPAVLASAWYLVTGILEAPATACDTNGTDINPTVCVPSFAYTDFATMISTCAA